MNPAPDDGPRADLVSLIEARLEALRRQLATHQEEQPRVERESNAYERDLEDAAQAAPALGVERSLFDLDTGEIDALEAARERILHGHGALPCRDCGDAIPWARLRAEPAAERCLACESHHERLLAGGGRSGG